SNSLPVCRETRQARSCGASCAADTGMWARARSIRGELPGHLAGQLPEHMDINTNLAGKVVLVTGGSRGLGRVIASEFAAAGCDVVVASRKLPSCENVAT